MFPQMSCHLLGGITKPKRSRGKELLDPLTISLRFLNLQGPMWSDPSLPFWPPPLCPFLFFQHIKTQVLCILPSFLPSFRPPIHPFIYSSTHPPIHPSIQAVLAKDHIFQVLGLQQWTKLTQFSPSWSLYSSSRADRHMYHAAMRRSVKESQTGLIKAWGRVVTAILDWGLGKASRLISYLNRTWMKWWSKPQKHRGKKFPASGTHTCKAPEMETRLACVWRSKRAVCLEQVW